MLIQVITGRYFSPMSPICDMVNRFYKFNMINELVKCVISIEPERDFLSDKFCIKKHILDVENQRWRATCLLYSSLDIFRNATKSINMNCWWIFSKASPLTTNKVSSLMAVMMGGQPSGYQQNFSRDACTLCDSQSYDNVIHVLFDCDKLSQMRCQLYQKLIASMPQALSEDFHNMTKREKLILMFSGYGQTYIPEWRNLYMNTAAYVDSLYKLRSNAYDALPIDNG